jgi:Insect cuticle protein
MNEFRGPNNVTVKLYTNEMNADGSYSFAYETEDGASRAETRDPSGQVVGKYSHLDPNGVLQTVEYKSGNNWKSRTSIQVNFYSFI